MPVSPSNHPTFFGREADLAALRRAVSARRLVTLSGAPGIGKTSLALRFLGAASEDLPGPVWLCELAHARDADALCAEVARRLEAGALPGGPPAVTAVGRALGARGRGLLVLDNFEQLLPAAAEIVLAWLDEAPEIHILVTSRETLRVDGELVQELAPLPEAAALFTDRAQRARPGWRPDAGEHATIDAIVSRLDRIPLAVELAAAQVRTLPPAELLARLPQQLHFAEAGTPPARHGTMREAIAWSWHLLAPHEKRALAAASVFRGGFTLEAAEAVLGDGRAPGEPPALDTVQALCDKSLLRAPRGDGRLGMFESIREAAAEKLAERGEAAPVELAHARFYLEQADVLGVRGELTRALDVLAPDRDNYQAILEAVATAEPPGADRVTRALHAAVVLDALSVADGLTYSQIRYVDAALEAPGEPVPGLVGRALVARAGWRASRSQPHAALEDCLAALELVERHGDKGLAPAAHMRTSFVTQTIGRMEEAAHHAGLAVQLYRGSGNEQGEAFAQLQEAAVLHSLGRAEEAAERHRTALAISRRIGFRMGEVRCGIGAGFHAMEKGHDAEARRCFDRVIELAAEVRAPRFAVIGCSYRGLLGLLQGRPAEAAADFEAALAGVRALANVLGEGRFLSFLATAAAELDDVARAERMAIDAEALLATSPLWLGVARVQHGCIDVARARAAAKAGDVEAEQHHREAARRRAEAARAAGPDGASLLDRSDDARLALRVLERAYARLDGATDGVAAGRLEIAAPRDGRFFRVALGARTDLSRRRPLRGIFAALLAKHEASPGEPLTNDELLAAGWPGERIPRKAALNRLRVALSSLREMGLRDVLVRREDGSSFHPQARVSLLPERGDETEGE